MPEETIDERIHRAEVLIEAPALHQAIRRATSS